MVEFDFLKITAAFYEFSPKTRLVIFLAVIIFIITIFFFLGRKIGQLESASRKANELRDARADAVKRSRSVLEGQLVEQIAPFLPNFPCSASDARFVGKPVDFIAFSGMSEKDEIREILLIEVKTGNSQLSEREKQIKRAVEQGRVRFVEWRT